MDGRDIEARVLMWAVAEISWQDASGQQCHAPATLEDRSNSGACVRLTRPVAVGSVVTIRWQREQFSAVAKNCRRDGQGFLIGVRRQAAGTSASKGVSSGQFVPAASAKVPQSSPEAAENNHPLLLALHAERERRRGKERVPETGAPVLDQTSSASGASPNAATAADLKRPGADCASRDAGLKGSQINAMTPNAAAPARPERKDMEPKTFLPRFWRHVKGPERLDSVGDKEVLVNKSRESKAESGSADRHELLSYEDIYHAAGIMNPASGYSIHKVVEMLNSERIRDLSKDVKRASVLMALDAAGTGVEDLLADATRRQDALNRYESGKRQQIEELESAKAREVKAIEEEMERVRAHYAERIQRNRDLVAQEKEDLRNWQMAVQHEMQRIAEVIEVCGKPSAATVPATSSRPTNGQVAPSEKSEEQSRAAASAHS